MGQQFVVDNRPGVSGKLGLSLLKMAPADGYTIGMGQGGNMSVAPHTYRKVPYHALNDFTPIALSATNYLAVYAERVDAAWEGELRNRDWPKGAPLNHVGIQVEDLDAVEERVIAAGLVPFSHGDYDPGRRFYFMDWDGIEFEIVSYA